MNPKEVTTLTPLEESAFQAWAAANGIKDVDHPDSFYDYRGYWKAVKGAAHPQGQHFPDTYKQHGHPSFSIESQYSQGPWDGGMWAGESYLPQMSPAVSHLPTPPQPDPAMIYKQLLRGRK